MSADRLDHIDKVMSPEHGEGEVARSSTDRQQVRGVDNHLALRNEHAIPSIAIHDPGNSVSGIFPDHIRHVKRGHSKTVRHLRRFADSHDAQLPSNSRLTSVGIVTTLFVESRKCLFGNKEQFFVALGNGVRA